MTPAASIIARATAAGIILEARGDRLRFDAPRGLPADLRDDLVEHKAEVLALLAPVEHTAPDWMPPAERLVADAARLGVRLKRDGEKVAIAGQSKACTLHELTALREGLAEFPVEVLALIADGPGTARYAEGWLLAYLSGGRKDFSRIAEDAGRRDIPEEQLRRAAEVLKVIVERESGVEFWQLPPGVSVI